MRKKPKMMKLGEAHMGGEAKLCDLRVGNFPPPNWLFDNPMQEVG